MRYRLIDTRLGPMAIGWTELGISRLMLPGDGLERMRERLENADGVEAAAEQSELAARIVAYAEGTPDSFDDIILDLRGVPEMSRRIYDHIRDVVWGETTTYGAIARWLGDVALSRAVGAAMGAN